MRGLPEPTMLGAEAAQDPVGDNDAWRPAAPSASGGAGSAGSSSDTRSSIAGLPALAVVPVATLPRTGIEIRSLTLLGMLAILLGALAISFAQVSARSVRVWKARAGPGENSERRRWRMSGRTVRHHGVRTYDSRSPDAVAKGERDHGPQFQNPRRGPQRHVLASRKALRPRTRPGCGRPRGGGGNWRG